MHLDQQAVRACGDRGLRQCRHHPRLAARMRRIDDHRQVGFFFQHRDRGHVQHVAVVGFEGADAALAEDDVVVAARRDVFRRHQPFGNGGRHAALEDHRLVDAADFLEQVEVLHVARADLDHVHVVFHERYPACATSISSVTMGSLYLLAALRNMSRPSTPLPWKV